MEYTNIEYILNDIITKSNTSNIYNIKSIVEKVSVRLCHNISLKEVYELIAEVCINMSTIDPIYSLLGGNILIYYLHSVSHDTFFKKVKYMKENGGLINDTFYNYVEKNKNFLNDIINYKNDYKYDYFGYKTLEKSYLLKVDGQIIESPQDLLLRCAITLQINNNSDIEKTYRYMSDFYYIHATPTLFNSGLKTMQLSSCYLLGVNDDLNDLCKSFAGCAQISKWSGGIGIHLSGIRANNSKIKGTNGITNGIVPLIKIYNDLSKWVDQGGKRQGSICIYLEPHHPDILEFLELRKNYGSDTERARDIFLALWVSDLFMEYVNDDLDWYLFSPDDCPGLNNVYGEEYKKLYNSYIELKLERKIIKARTIWSAVISSQIETGMPYISFKDTVNNNSNQKNIGIIKSSNLCNEIVQYSDNDEYAVCNLASISLKSCIDNYDNCELNTIIIYEKENCVFCDYAKNYLSNKNIKYNVIEFSTETVNNLKKILNKENITFPQIFLNTLDTYIGGWNELYNYIIGKFNFKKLYDISYLATVNLNNVIDINYYPVPETKKSNMAHRPIGLGIQGLADTLSLLKIPFDSEESIKLNAKILETIYLGSMTASNDIAKDRSIKIKILVKDLIERNINFPDTDYYDCNYEISNILYHMLRPTKNELNSREGYYSTFPNSPFSKGIFQFDFYPNTNLIYPDRWKELKQNVIKYGTRNSLLTALMPTASTSQILGNNECFEHFTNNIYTRKTQAGDFIMINKYLVNDLKNLNMWDIEIKNTIVSNNGSIQNIKKIPNCIKLMYKTIWEIKQIWVLRNSRARAPFVDQSQSMNIFFSEPDYQKLTSSHFWAWRNKLKTGMYYLRSKPAINPIQITIDPNMINNINVEEENICLNCSG